MTVTVSNQDILGGYQNRPKQQAAVEPTGESVNRKLEISESA